MSPARYSNPIKGSDWRHLINELESQGWRFVVLGSGHVQFFAPNGKCIVLVSGSPSDHRAFQKILSDLRRCGYVDPKRKKNPLPATVLKKNRYGQRKKTGTKGGDGSRGGNVKVVWAIEQDEDKPGPIRVGFDFFAWEDAWDAVLDDGAWSDPKRAERFAIHAATAFARHLKRYGLDGARSMWDRSTGWYSQANAPDIAIKPLVSLRF